MDFLVCYAASLEDNLRIAARGLVWTLALLQTSAAALS